MLTEKEIDVLRWAGEGLNDRQLAARLNISIGTVRYRWAAVFRKLDANGRVNAVAQAVALGIVSIHLPADAGEQTALPSP